MWSTINPSSQNSNRLSNLKQLKLIPLQSNQPPLDTDQSSTTDTTGPPAIWRKELRLSTVVERQRKKLSTATSSSSSTSTSYSHSSPRMTLTPFDLPRLDHRLCDLDEKLEGIENMMSARQQFFQVLSRDSNILNCDLQKELRRNSQPYQLPQSNTSKIPEEAENNPPSQTKSTPSFEHHEDPSAISQTSADPSGSGFGWGEYFKKKLW